jgi:hypothetical protein
MDEFSQHLWDERKAISGGSKALKLLPHRLVIGMLRLGK